MADIAHEGSTEADSWVAEVQACLLRSPTPLESRFALIVLYMLCLANDFSRNAVRDIAEATCRTLS